jgi:hypothetical protein
MRSAEGNEVADVQAEDTVAARNDLADGRVSRPERESRVVLPVRAGFERGLENSQFSARADQRVVGANRDPPRLRRLRSELFDLDGTRPRKPEALFD